LKGAAATLNDLPTQRDARWSHRLAVVLFACVCPLVFVGAGVTSKDAGMVFHDAPTSDGYWFNPPGWFGNDHKRWEHGHRLLGYTVGIASLAAVAGAWHHRRRTLGTEREPVGRLHLALALVVLIAICIQGSLGRWRVNHASTGFAMLHGVWGQVCLALSALLMLVTSRTWGRGLAAARQSDTVGDGRLLQRIGLATMASVLAQQIAGVVLRHSGTGLAMHLFGAVIVVCLAAWLSMWVIGRFPTGSLPNTLGRIVLVLVTVQLFLGVGAYVATQIPGFGGGEPWGRTVAWLLPSLHVLVGALLLAATVGLSVSLPRTLRELPNVARAEVVPA